ncbi:MAG: ion channel [Pseudomonadota bacterium]
MAAELGLAAALVFASTLVQAAFIGAVFHALTRAQAWLARAPRSLSAALALGLAALWMMAAHGVAIGLWAAAFHGLGVFPDLDTSVYFSAVAFTTLGFGDVIPPPEWRQLAGLCAANGLLAFGVSAAVLVEVLREARGGPR